MSIDQARRQVPIQDRPGQDRQTQEIARQNLNRAANRKRDIDAGLRQIERDLPARISQSDHQHPLAQIWRRIAVVAAMDDRASIDHRARPGWTVWRARDAGRDNSNRRRDRPSRGLRTPLHAVAPQA